MRESFETSSNQFLPRQNEVFSKPLDEFVESLVFFARVLSPPTQALVDLLRNDPGLPGNGSWILFYPEDPELLKILQQEHTRLFVSAYPELNPSPFASSLLNPKHPQQTLQEIEALFQIRGWSYEGGRCDRLEVLLEAGSQIGNEAERREFLNRYCRPWLVDFAEQLASRASLPFYPGLLGAIGELLESELAEEEG